VKDVFKLQFDSGGKKKEKEKEKREKKRKQRVFLNLPSARRVAYRSKSGAGRCSLTTTKPNHIKFIYIEIRLGWQGGGGGEEEEEEEAAGATTLKIKRN